MLRRAFKNRFVIPAALLFVVGFSGLLAFSSGANASSKVREGSSAANGGLGPGLSAGGGVGAGNFAQGIALPGAVGSPSYTGGPKNTGLPNSSIKNYIIVNGKKVLASYGDSSILYEQPLSQTDIAQGQVLFGDNCASCHGNDAGGSAIAPPINAVGPATVDFWVSTGRMPATSTNDVEAERKNPRLNGTQAYQVAAYVNSLHPSTPFIPTVNLNGANLADGADLFSLNCAACHTITGAGDALAYGTNAPTLIKNAISAQQIAEAIRTGPANMPRFSGNLTDAQVRDLVAYVTENLQHPTAPGGFGLGGVGPVAEGFVAVLIGVGVLMLVAFWVGERTVEESHHE
jgi:ubiquinol-cytochrome c reductase cytochrome c subunit